jgi:hypothetical protein
MPSLNKFCGEYVPDPMIASSSSLAVGAWSHINSINQVVHPADTHAHGDNGVKHAQMPRQRLTGSGVHDRVRISECTQQARNRRVWQAVYGLSTEHTWDQRTFGLQAYIKRHFFEELMERCRCVSGELLLVNLFRLSSHFLATSVILK